MISKLIVWGEDRQIAVQKMRKALSEYKIGGMVTNLPLLKRILDHPKFADFSYDLKFIDENQSKLVPTEITVSDDVLIGAVFSIINTSSDKLCEQNDFFNFRLNHNFKTHFDLELKNAHSQSAASLKLKGHIVQHSDGSIKLSARLMDTKGKETRKVNIENIQVKRSSDNSVQIYVDGVQKEVQLYSKHH